MSNVIKDNLVISDQELIMQILNNDQKALEILVKRYLSLVYSVAFYYVGNYDDAQDVAQEVFVKVWKNLAKFELEKKFSSWVYQIAKNTSLDWLKKKKSVPFSDFADVNGKNYLAENICDFSSDLSELVDRVSDAVLLKSSLDRLPLLYQEVVTSHSQDGMTFQEIAESTSQSINTVKSRYRRALASMKKIISKNY